MKRIVSVMILGCILQSCASTLALMPQALEDQETIFQEGVEAIVSPKNSLVAVRPLARIYSSEERPTLVVTVLNGSDEPYDLSTENIRVSIDDHPHKVFTYDELVAEIERQQAWAAFAVAVSGAAQSYNAASAGTTFNSGSYNISAYDQYGNRGYGYGTYSGYSYNPAAAQQAQTAANAQTQANMQAIKSQTQQSLNSLSSTILKKTTVFPQAWHGGYVVLDQLPAADTPQVVKLTITASGEEHQFLFKLVTLE